MESAGYSTFFLQTHLAEHFLVEVEGQHKIALELILAEHAQSAVDVEIRGRLGTLGDLVVVLEQDEVLLGVLFGSERFGEATAHAEFIKQLRVTLMVF